MGTYYHQETLRKQRTLERAQAAKARAQHRDGGYDILRGDMRATEELPAKITMERAPREPIHRGYIFNSPHHPIRHRKVDNTSADQITQYMKPEYKDFKAPAEQLPRRKTHVKV